MKRLIPALLVLALLLCGCNGAEEATTTAATTEATAAPTTEATAAPTTEATEPTAPVTYRHPLNGAILEAPYTGRPVTFTIGNTDEARPQYGISKADIFYEICVEGGLTRCMPVFSDLSDVGPIGSIRSARTYFVSISRAYNALFMHSGASYFAATLLNQNVVDHVNGDDAVFYRDADRAAAGYAYEHRHFVNGAKAHEFLQKNFNMTGKADANYGLSFVDQQTLEGDSAKSVRVNFGTGYAKATMFTYDEAQGNYTTSLFTQGMKLEKWIDASTGEPMRFENLLVLYAKRTPAPGATAGNVLHELVGGNDGYYVSGGKVVPIKWTRASEDAPFRYTLTDGTPLNVIPGKTYVGIVPLQSPIEFE